MNYQTEVNDKDRAEGQSRLNERLANMNDKHRICVNNGCQRVEDCDQMHRCELMREANMPFTLNDNAQNAADGYGSQTTMSTNANVALEDIPDNELSGMWERADFM